MAKDKNKNAQLALGGETPKEKIKPILIEEEMRSSYIEYAMSVIVGRALPDARDGLKPVHRRILYSMYDQGMDATKPYKKSARVVGDVLGKYHPHGDLAIYESLVRMAQDFSLRYPLVDGQGNFGSIDGDGAAAMRYTEARMSKIASELLADLDKETVDFTPNFDESTKEPSVLPTKLPNLLLNGSSGIAVGMATNIPPHNLKEICLAVEALIADPETSVKKLMKFVTGPDFPTGGIIRGAEGIKSAYETGKGSITVTGKFSVEPAYKKKDRMSIVITEIPYMINKSNMIEKIAELVREKKIEGISDLRDESGREGMRIYIELKKEANAQIVIKQLLKYTTLQSNFSVNLLAIVDGEPKVCNLKDLLEEFIKHRFEVITRRTKYELRKAEERAHILEGLLIALANLDAVIKLIRGSKAPEDAKAGLIKNFKLSEIQAHSILDMRLQRLTQLESLKVKTEHKELMEKIKDYKDILAKKSRVFGIISSETKEIREKYGDDRRTEIQGAIQEVNVEDLIPKDEVAVFITMQGFVKRLPIKTFRNQMRGGKGVVGMATREEDVIEKIYVTSTHSYLMCFTNFGKAYSFKVYDIPDASRVSKGQSIENFLELSAGEQVTTAIPVENLESKDFLVMATKRGTIKKTEVSEFANLRRSGVIAIVLEKGDELDYVQQTDGKTDIVMGTQEGLIIRFKEKDVRPMGRSSKGVTAIKLSKEDAVISMDCIKDPKSEILVISERGYGKRTPLNEFKVQGRAGKGIKLMTIKKDKTGPVARMRVVNADDEIMIVTNNGTVSKQLVKNISVQHRAASGVILQRVGTNEKVVDLGVVAKVPDEE